MFIPEHMIIAYSVFGATAAQEYAKTMPTIVVTKYTSQKRSQDPLRDKANHTATATTAEEKHARIDSSKILENKYAPHP